MNSIEIQSIELGTRAPDNSQETSSENIILSPSVDELSQYYKECLQFETNEEIVSCFYEKIEWHHRRIQNIRTEIEEKTKIQENCKSIEVSINAILGESQCSSSDV